MILNETSVISLPLENRSLGKLDRTLGMAFAKEVRLL